MKDLFNIQITGYFRHKYRIVLPSRSGIYFVYENRYVPFYKSVSIEKLLYIGFTNNLKNCVSDHKDYEKWLEQVADGNEICYTFSEIPKDYERIALALVSKHKPPFNLISDKVFPSEPSTINLSGETPLLSNQIIVQ